MSRLLISEHPGLREGDQPGDQGMHALTEPMGNPDGAWGTATNGAPVISDAKTLRILGSFPSGYMLIR